jgi:anti-anti-sigma factor
MEITFSTVESNAPVTIMHVKGRLDSSSLGYFMDQARHAIDGGARDILLDFTEVPFMSSVGIRALSAVYEWLHPVKSAEDQRFVSQAVHDGTYHAPHLKLLNPNPSILKTIHLVALDRYLEIFTDEQKALASFSPSID